MPDIVLPTDEDAARRRILTVLFVGVFMAALDAAVTEAGAATLRDMGKVMAVLKARHTGQMDFGAVGALLKARLG